MSARNLFMIVSLGLSVLIGMTLANRRGANAGSAANGDAKQPVIGLSMDTLKEARWQVDRDLFTKRCEELGARVLVQSANSDDAQQMRDVQSLLSAGVQVLVIIPHDGLAMSAAADLAHKSGVPVIAYDRIIRDCDLDLYLSFDNIRVGEMQARFVVDGLPTPGRGHLLRIYGAPSDNNARLFKQGQDNVLKAF